MKMNSLALNMVESDKYEQLKNELCQKARVTKKRRRSQTTKENLQRSGARNQTKTRRSLNIHFERNRTGFNLHIERVKSWF